MKQKTVEGGYIDLGHLLQALLYHWKLVVCFTILFAGGAFAYSRLLVTPMYSASALMMASSGERYDNYVSSDQLNSAVSLVNTYSIIISGDVVVDQVIDNLDMGDRYHRVVDSINVSSVNSTQVVRITVNATSSADALAVCQELTNVAPLVIQDTIELGSLKMVSPAQTSGKPVSPNVTNNTLMGGLLGFLLACGLVCIYTLMNNKVSSERDIAAAELPLLGVIPSYDMED